MVFFHLNWPKYASDAEMEARNCCFSDPTETLSVPGVQCPYCRTTWAMSGGRLVTDTSLSFSLREQLAKPRVETLDEHYRIVQQLRQELDLSPSDRVLPGTDIDQLAVWCNCTESIQDFMWDVGSFVVSQRVVDTLVAARLTGYRVYPVRITNAEEIAVELPRLYRLIVVGQGGPMAAEAGLRMVSECSKCGYRQYEDVYWGRYGPNKFHGLYVDPETWDGSDFFTFDDWPTIIIVTEKVRSVLASAGCSNWRAWPTPLGACEW